MESDIVLTDALLAIAGKVRVSGVYGGSCSVGLG